MANKHVVDQEAERKHQALLWKKISFGNQNFIRESQDLLRPRKKQRLFKSVPAYLGG